MSVSSPRFALSLTACALVCSLAACGGSPVQGNSSGGDGADPTAAEEVYSKFGDMPAGPARTEELAQACQDEGELVINTSSSAAAPLAEAFQKKYDGINVRLVEPTSSEAQRQVILQEHQAGQVRSDLVTTYADELSHIFGPLGVTAKYSSDVIEQVDERVQSENYIPLFQYAVVPQWNTNLVSEDEAPTSYADLADPKWKGKLGLVRGDGNWYFTLYDWFTNEGGMSPAEFEEMFRGIAENARAFDGHGTVSLVAAGEVPLLVNGFQSSGLPLIEDGSPIRQDPPLEPVGMLLFGLGMMTTAKHPACAVLFSEWAATEGQQTIVDIDYYPVNFEALSEDVPFSVEDYEVAHIPVDEVNEEEFGEWMTAFDNLVRGSGDVLPDFAK